MPSCPAADAFSLCVSAHSAQSIRMPINFARGQQLPPLHICVRFWYLSVHDDRRALLIFCHVLTTASAPLDPLTLSVSVCSEAASPPTDPPLLARCRTSVRPPLVASKCIHQSQLRHWSIVRLPPRLRRVRVSCSRRWFRVSCLIRCRRWSPHSMRRWHVLIMRDRQRQCSDRWVAQSMKRGTTAHSEAACCCNALQAEPRPR